MRRHLRGVCAAAGWAYALGMVLSVSAAQNPCPAQYAWEWKVPPSLEIDGPRTFPDQCVGPLSIGPATVTFTDGVRWEVDQSDCQEPPRNETTVPVNPENGWSLYTHPGVGSAIPMSDGGLPNTFSANFTALRGGEYDVQFQTEAHIPNPLGHTLQAAYRTEPFRVFEVTNLEPSAGVIAVDTDSDPNTTLYVVAPPLSAPGTITVTATPTPSAPANELPECWTLSGSEGVTIVNKLTATLDASVPGTHVITCQAGASYKQVTIAVVRLLPVEFKRNDEPANFFSEHGGGDVVLNESFDWRMQVEGDTSAIDHLLKWAVRGLNMQVIEQGTGLEFTRAMTPLGPQTVQFWIDCDANGVAFNEPARVNHTEIVNLVDIPLVIKRHTNVAFSNSDADTLLANATGLLRNRDQLDDRRCGVRLLRHGSVGTFPAPEFVWNQETTDQAFGIPDNVKVVVGITFPSTNVVGRTIFGQPNSIIEASATASTWAHEVGHQRGILGDYPTPIHRIMSTGTQGGSTLSETERNRYRKGPQ